MSRDEMPHIDVPVERLRFAQTSRTDRWWVTPLVVFTVRVDPLRLTIAPRT